MSASMSMQFDRPEFAPGTASPAVACTSCKQPLVQSYYEANGHVICGACRERFLQAGDDGSGARMFKAFFGALPVGLIGGAVWWAVETFIHVRAALISIGIGYYVGKVVRAASGHRGGLPYQLIAVAVTYIGICSSYVPWIVQADPGFTLTASSLIDVALRALEGPFLYPMGILGYPIIGFGLWEAWKLNKRTELTINGPFSVSPAAHG